MPQWRRAPARGRQPPTRRTRYARKRKAAAGSRRRSRWRQTTEAAARSHRSYHSEGFAPRAPPTRSLARRGRDQRRQGMLDLIERVVRDAAGPEQSADTIHVVPPLLFRARGVGRRLAGVGRRLAGVGRRLAIDSRWKRCRYFWDDYDKTVARRHCLKRT